MNVIHRTFEDLKLSAYQSFVYMSFTDKSSKYIENVLNRQRSYIDMSQAMNVSTDCANLVNEFKDNAFLMSMSLRVNHIGSENAKRIADGISVSASLTQVLAFQKLYHLRSRYLTDVVLLLTQIDLGSNNIGGHIDDDNVVVHTSKGPQAIADVLRVSKSLTSINLSCNYIGVEGAKHIAKGICDSNSLMSIDLSDNEISTVGAKDIAQAIFFSASLTECNVRGNQIDAETATTLANIGTEKRIMLFGIKHDQTEANFKDESIESVNALLIGSDLTVSASLTSINLKKNRFEIEGAEYIAKGISVSASLTIIDLSSNDLGDGCAKHIAEGISVNVLLTSINLSQNEISYKGAKHIAKAIGVSASLTSINLFDNRIGKEGAKYVAEGISVSTSLTSIDLSWNRIGNEGAKHIAESIAVSASLTQVLAFYKLPPSLSHPLTAVVLLLA